MTVRGLIAADGRTVEHGQFGGFLPEGDLEAERQLADVLVGAAERLAGRPRAELRVRGLCEATGVPYTAIGKSGGDALHVGDLFDVRLDELRAGHGATLTFAFER